MQWDLADYKFHKELIPLLHWWYGDVVKDQLHFVVGKVFSEDFEPRVCG
jgi:hypothetical protein